MKFKVAVIIFLLGTALGVKSSFGQDSSIRYVAIGDSYSIGTGVDPKEAWPVLLTERLRADGLDISLVANPGRNGWTTVDAQQWEIPALRKSQANFATLMMGANDWFQNSTQERFRANFADLLDDMLSQLPANKILVINIPDFSLTLRGSRSSPGRDIAKGVKQFNKIIAQICKQKKVAWVDIYTVSQQMRLDPQLTAEDGLHPSAKGQILFMEAIYPQAREVLNIKQ